MLSDILDSMFQPDICVTAVDSRNIGAKFGWNPGKLKCQGIVSSLTLKKRYLGLGFGPTALRTILVVAKFLFIWYD